MRPKSITFLCITLFLLGGLQFVGSLGGIMIGNGLGPEKIFRSTSKYEIPTKYLIDAEPEIPVAAEPGLITEVPEHIIPAAQYGLLVSFFLIISVIMLWKMKKSGVYIFVAISAGNIVMQVLWQPKWLIQSQYGIWFSLVILAITLLVVLPHWKQLSLPASQIKKKPPREVTGLDVFNLGNPNIAIKPAPSQETEKK
ncbi:hypothetical protein MNBD_GAMMA26-1088 [hydrothermal vent metagenome]|uniref:Uncharacterized protein n=1 Tax=hydrothermal vent metagenome TaxID=652676 RepID=A0A3B1BA79_9ZZZZ